MLASRLGAGFISETPVKNFQMGRKRERTTKRTAINT
jgi:hypothetical protein